MRKLLIGIAGIAAMTLGMASAAVAADKTKVCFVYVGSKTDGGWTQAHDIGRMELQAHFGDKVETAFIENVLTKKPVSPSFEDGRRAQMLADAAQKSLETGLKVTLDW